MHALADCMTNRQAGLQEVSADHQRRSGADRKVRLFAGQEMLDWLRQATDSGSYAKLVY